MIAQLVARRRQRRRLASACFFVAGVGFGTALYLLRARFALLRDGRVGAFALLLAVTVGAFLLGARAENEITQLDEQIRELEATAPRRPGSRT